ncbi:MAG: hypothetical protein WKF84_26055 [Pyrinomonadaceae bacterium]
MSVLLHLLGNFTTNHSTRIEVSTNQLRVRFVVDMAEISTSLVKRLARYARRLFMSASSFAVCGKYIHHY